MKRQLPSFPSLRAFEAAARLLSFKAAAEELCVTQSAISHQVKILEAFLGAPLFIRSPQKVALTLRGSEYLEMVTHLLDDLDSATQRFRGGADDGPLYVQASPAFTSIWLLPRMIRFNRLYPDIELNLSTISDGDAAEIHPFDARVNCSWEVSPESGGEPLMTSSHVPVCHPRLIRDGLAIETIEDMWQYPILRAQGSWDLWDRWFDSLGYEQRPQLSGPRLENTYLALQAAEEGMGIALGPIALIQEKVALGRLVVLLELEGATALYFTLSCAGDWRHQPKILAFREWLHRELGACSGLDMTSSKTAATR